MKYKFILIIVALAFTAVSCNKQTSPPASQNTSVKVETVVLTSLEIVVSENGFSPKDLTIKKGNTLTFVNKANRLVWPASDPHPTHTDYVGFDPKKGIEPGSSWSFTLNQAGEWAYHNHLSPFRRGTITVTD